MIIYWSGIKPSCSGSSRVTSFTFSSIFTKINIDLLIVDGPPRIINKNARYPALPLLKDHFSDNIVILVDDAKRKDDSDTVKRWIDEWDYFESEFFATEKGAYILRKK